MAADLLAADVAWLTVYPDGTVHDEAGCRDYRADGLYERLLYAGVPLWSQTDGSRDGCIQVHTDGRQVTALLDADDRRTVIPAPAAAVLTDWWRTAQPDHEEP